MRYLCMHKVSPRDEAGELPPQELIDGMGRLIGETAQRGQFLAGEGLRPSSTRYRLTATGAGWSVEPGPWPGDGELPQRLVILKVATVDEAIDWARRLGTAAGARRLELGPLTEPWDLGMLPRPAQAPLRFMILEQATAASEAGEPPPPARQVAVRAVLSAMQEASVLLFTEVLRPSSQAMRLRYRDGERTRIDGPFTESKELIGGFCMVQMRSFDEIAAWADRFAKVIGGTCEVDVRVVADAPEAGR